MRIETWLPQYLPLLQQAAARYDLDWRLLAGIAMTESSGDPTAIGPLLRDGQQAEGLMQFLPSTFYGTAGADASPQQVAEAGGYGVDGDRDGRVTPLYAADAIFSAAHYLAALGAHQDLATALQRYSG
ncbi:MAG: transglycosylase SLT domain-containing protein [Firmicutes bacterium]|nr:transglycosylase SLT domain-containing protein [Bacillota bacterium]